MTVTSSLPVPDDKVIKFTNCRLCLGGHLIPWDLWVSATTGRILDHQRAFYEQYAKPALVHNLGGRILAPGFIDVQINGGYGFDFSVPGDGYGDGLREVNRQLVKTGVTGYLPTLTSQKPDVYEKVLPHLKPRTSRRAEEGAEILGAHCEGPFLSPQRSGIHQKEALQHPSSIAALERCYGAEHLSGLKPTIKMVTMAPELDPPGRVISELASRGIIVSAGHSNATYEQMSQAVRHGATMVTHLFNAIAQVHHRGPGIFGVLGLQELTRPYFGIIADDIHVHRSVVRVAYNAHPEGTILVTDAMRMLGLPDGIYDWTNGEVIEKRGGELTLKDTDRIAGSCVTLLECLNNLIKWTGASIPEAVKTVTSTPARMLELEDIKGSLRPGADADLVVLSEVLDERGRMGLKVDEVWKFGVRVYAEEDRFSARL